NEWIVDELNASEPTVVDWKSFRREVCGDIIIRGSKKLGGVGQIVEIDESKFGKKKYRKGKRVEEKWVFGGIERGSKESLFLRGSGSKSPKNMLSLGPLFFPTAGSPTDRSRRRATSTTPLIIL
ncbi:hypothetical protein AVEN_62537-1, partial [Araneus ventricosus]